jgi:hypothetical protein
MKELLQPKRTGTAQANMKAYRVNSATNTRSRSIHKRQEHLDKGQHQQLNEEIMKERDKIVKYNRQYMRKY